MELKGIISDSLVSGTIRNGARLNGTVLAANTGATQNDHSVALNRDLPNQHPMSAITGLPEVFWATYNETSYADIRAAYDAGKTVLLHHPDSIILPLKQFGYDDWMQADYAEFYGVVGLASPYVYEARCDASQNFWTRTRSLLATSGTTGALSNLDTTAKNNLVAAVNEVNAKAAGTFWATYNTTPFADIVAAHNAGKAVFVKESGQVYALDYVTSHYVTFSLFSVSSFSGQYGSFNEAYCYGIKVTDGEVWSTYDDQLALKSDIGSRADLTTTAKDNLVAAVNEVNAKADTLVVYRFTVSSTNYNNLAKGTASVTSGPTAAEVLAAAAELSSSDKTILAIVALAGGTGRSYVVPLTYFKGTNPYPTAGFSGFIDNRMDIVLYTNGNSWAVRFKDYSAEILEAEDRLLNIIGDDTALTTTDKSDLVSAINEINAKASGDGLTDAAKQALLQLARKVAYVDENGEEYYQDLYEALYNEQTYTVTNNLTDVTNNNISTRVVQGGSYLATLTATSGYTINSVTITMGGVNVTGTAYSSGTISIANVTGNIVITAVATQRQATLLSIAAAFSQGSAVIYDNATLDSLKQYLIVTANYDDSSSETLADSVYTLSGTLTAGTSTITASYGGKTDTFTVTVTHYTIPMLYNWDFTQSLTDTEQNVTVTSLSGYAPTRDSSGLSFTAARQQISVPVSIDLSGKTLEVDVASFEFAGNTGYHIRFVMLNSDPTNSMGLGVLVYQSGTAWKAYGSLAATGTSADWSGAWSSGLTGNSDEIRNAFSGKTVKIVFNEDGHTMSLYRDNVLDGTLTSRYFSNPNMRYISIGGLQTGGQNAGNQIFNAVITGMRIYENE